MEIEEIEPPTVLESSGEPDGSILPVIDSYDGCTIGCPYCYQWDNKEWNSKILAKTNLPNLIRKQFRNWSKTEILFFGDKSDPYMAIEEKYEITRNSISALKELEIPTILCSKADNEIILRDIDILKKNNSSFKIVLGVSNITEIMKHPDYTDNVIIRNANRLYNCGIDIHLFITPLLPGITNVHAILDALNPNINISIDKFWWSNNSQAKKRLSSFINDQFPNLKKQYSNILEDNNFEYYDSVVNEFANSNRVSFLRDSQGNGIFYFILNHEHKFEAFRKKS